MQTEYTKGPTTTLSSSVPSCRSLSSSEDGPSGHSSLSDGKLTWNVQDSIKHRILYLSEQLRVEKASRDENTVGYLKLVSKADRHQALHIRQAFEKVNQRTSATIAQIERRLRQCHQQLQELEEGCRPKDLVLGTKSSLDNNCKQPREKVLCAEPPRPGGEDCSSSDLSTVIRHVPLQAHFPACQQQRSLESKCGAQPRALLEQKMKEELREVKMVHLSLQESYQSLREQYLTDLQASLESLQKEKSRWGGAPGHLGSGEGRGGISVPLGVADDTWVELPCLPWPHQLGSWLSWGISSHVGDMFQKWLPSRECFLSSSAPGAVGWFYSSKRLPWWLRQ